VYYRRVDSLGSASTAKKIGGLGPPTRAERPVRKVGILEAVPYIGGLTRGNTSERCFMRVIYAS